MDGDIYRRPLPVLYQNIVAVLGIERPGEIGLPRLNKDQLITLLLAIKKMLK